MRTKQSGNVLFLILIAVALFAALSYAITSSSRGGGNIAREKAILEISTVMQWYATAQANMQRLAIREGIPLDQIRINSGNNWTACTTGDTCLWATEGGDVPYQPDFPAGVRTGSSDSVYDRTAAGSNVSGFSNTIWFELYGISKEFCDAYQTYLKLGAPGSSQNTYPGEYTACYQFSGASHAIYFVLYGET